MTFQVYPEPDQRIPPPPPIDLGKVCFLAVLIAGLLVGASAIAHGQTAPGNNAITPVSYTHLTLPTNREV